MRVLVCPNSFKGSLSNVEATLAISQGLKMAGIEEVVEKPLADGGEGTLEAFAYNVGGQRISYWVTGPWGEKLEASVLLWKDTVLVEMAQAAGLLLLAPSQYNPRFTTTYGVGELLGKALALNAKIIILGVGGSATTDGGMGALQALGVRFLDAQGKELFGIGDHLPLLASVDFSGMIFKPRGVDFVLACDVDNPLYGENGAAYMYAPQKGASYEDVVFLDVGLRHYAEILRKFTGVSVDKLPGGGAGGGIAAGLFAFWGGKIVSGAELLLQIFGLEEEIRRADWVVSGEGKIDHQTVCGKLPWRVKEVCERYQKPLILIAGLVEKGMDSFFGEHVALFPLVSGDDPQKMEFERAFTLLFELSLNLGKVMKGGRKNLGTAN
ncbi:MAG: glycerate kinase family protein [Candidatus Caldatribacteriaceae bacterium]